MPHSTALRGNVNLLKHKMETTNILSIAKDVFISNQKLDVSEYVKVLKKTGKSGSSDLEYIPWSSCLYLMKQHHPNLAFITKEFNGVPFLKLEDGTCMVVTTIIDVVTGKESLPSFYPVMEGFSKKAVVDPDARNISDNTQRARAKALAEVTGIGLNLWMRVEVESSAEEEEPTREIKKSRPSPTPTRKREVEPEVEEEEEEYEEEEDEEVFETEDKKPLARTTRPAARKSSALFDKKPSASRSRSANPFA